MPALVVYREIVSKHRLKSSYHTRVRLSCGHYRTVKSGSVPVTRARCSTCERNLLKGATK